MAEYIEREALLHKIRWASTPEECVMSVRRMPAANVEPVRPIGHWKIDDGRNHCHCTNCLFGRDIRTQIDWDYCPNCGAKMDAKEEMNV